MLEIAIGNSVVNLPYTAEDGSQPLVITTPAEYLSEVISRIELAGGAANVVIAYAKTFHVFSIKGDKLANVLKEHDPDEVNNDMSMGMFFMRSSRKGEGWFRLAGTNVESSAPRQFAYSN